MNKSILRMSAEKASVLSYCRLMSQASRTQAPWVWLKDEAMDLNDGSEMSGALSLRRQKRKTVAQIIEGPTRYFYHTVSQSATGKWY